VYAGTLLTVPARRFFRRGHLSFKIRSALVRIREYEG
jgi:hypothetical protein